MNRRLAVLGAAAVAVGALTVGTTPAAASGTGSGYVSGAGTYADDFGDEGTLSTSSYKYSNATCLWQRILYAEGELGYSEIDGAFGDKTKSATVRLQKRWKLGADGQVGNKTFGKADAKLRYRSGSAGSGYKLRYDGSKYDVYLERNSAGKYSWVQDGGTRLAGYKYRSCK